MTICDCGMDGDPIVFVNKVLMQRPTFVECRTRCNARAGVGTHDWSQRSSSARQCERLRKGSSTSRTSSSMSPKSLTLHGRAQMSGGDPVALEAITKAFTIEADLQVACVAVTCRAACRVIE